MADPDYPWPKYSTGHRDHLQAIGVISLNFNLYEYALIVFFEHYMPKPVAEYLFDTMSNEERAGAIRALVKAHEVEPEKREAVEYALTHFAVCAENRHNLLHSHLLGGNEDMLAIEKTVRRDHPRRFLEFRLKLGDLRRAADEMWAGFNHALDLWHYLQQCAHHRLMVEAAERGECPPPTQAPSLPKKPPAPRKIDPHQQHATA